ncbi:uncharacterized protein PV09_01051 [Verruconis gallopava]|uniref:Vegetatible incompatibility protein HET-E-1 n=1 Tax=Verruconis gallopava TaxID=253628 RepID=A0A0D1XZ86_9PEZI|nr:uncharacterized protein PV09_01051 [Verruconis gallopava]KIW08116.1 hypothetical protein PV09_01051 [Verruconis gallopava]
MGSYEEARQKQIAKNKALFEELKLQHAGEVLQGSRTHAKTDHSRAKRRKLETKSKLPQRSSARLAGAEAKPVYVEDELISSEGRPMLRQKSKPTVTTAPHVEGPRRSGDEIKRLREQWSMWKPTAELPERDDDGTFHFEDHPDFLPNKSPAEMMREGCFGGTYWRPLYSKALGITVEDDWKELPADWIEGLDVKKYLTSAVYDAEVNKFGVAAGQSIEAWEAAGWIDHEHDVRGWFQWYCRFFQGRRCEDDERQISRWKKCVGETGRWRRTLLKKYEAAGIRSVMDEGEDDVEGVSPVIHQTCHHWAWEVRQHVLDAWWNRT